MNWDSWKYPSHFKGLGLTNREISFAVMGASSARSFLHAGQPAIWRDDNLIASAISGSGLDVETLVEHIARAVELDAAQTAAILTKFANVEWQMHRAREVNRWVA